MLTTTSEVADESVVWKAVAGVHAVVFLGKSEGKPVAIVELRPGHGFHVTMCSGESLGQFDSLADGQAAVAHRMSR